MPLNVRSLASFTIALAVSLPAVPHVLQVPFFRDDGGAMTPEGPTGGIGAAAFITARNTSGDPITLYLVYQQPDPSGGVVMQQAVPYTLAAYGVVNFRPAKDDPVEADSRAVPNVLAGLGSSGSLQIIWIGGPEAASAIVGRYHEVSNGRDMGHVLLPEMLPNE